MNNNLWGFCLCMFSLMDPFLPRSSWRPSPFLLQDAHPPSVYRSLHLQTPAAASLVPSTTLNTWPQLSQKKTHKHRSASRALMCSPPTCNPRIINLLYRYTTDFSTWVKTPRLGEGFGSDLSPPLKTEHLSKRHQDLLKRGVHFMLWIKGLLIWSCKAQTKESLWIKAVCSLAILKRKKQHYIHIHIYITWRCAIACIIVILSSNCISLFSFCCLFEYLEFLHIFVIYLSLV